eukprot:11570388-Alexandrium_andersonii.AAC.1
MAWIRDQGWGPAAARVQQREERGRLRRVGLTEAPEWCSEAARRETVRDQRLFARPEASQMIPQLSRGQARALGPSLYRAAW